MKFYLVRHGQTEWNHSHRFQGWVDIELDSIGLIQAKMLSNHFKSIRLDFIYTSDLKRALKTAQIIQMTHECPMRLSSEFREMNVGNWEGKTWEEIKVEYADQLSVTEEKLIGLTVSGGESLIDFQHRIIEAFMPLLDRKHEHVLIVTHGGVIRVLLCHILGYDLSQRDVFKIDNGSITIIESDAKKQLKVIEQNIISHMK